MSALDETYRVEMSKWDAIADAESDDASALPEYAEFDDWLAEVAEFFGALRGKRVLEYGCGLGKATALLAKTGAEVSAFDISPKSVDIARRRLEANGLQADVDVAVGEALPYEDESFDVVFGAAVLHHLDVSLAGPELVRVLKSGGKAAFVEPMGMNPILNFAREHMPYRAKTPRGADSPVTYEDLAAWGAGFSEYRYRESQLLGMIQRFFGYRQRFALLHRVDDALLRRLPFLRRYCRYVVVYGIK